MMKFLDKRSGITKTVYSIVVEEDKVCVKFTKNGMEYFYNPSSVEILTPQNDETTPKPIHNVFVFFHECYKCKQETPIFTYIVFSDNPDEDVTFPWDKERLLEHQDIYSHFIDPSIEYYGLDIVGSHPELDEVLMKEFPNDVQLKYSHTQKKKCVMNICRNCGAKQGEYFIYRHINKIISNMEELSIIKKISAF